MSIHDHNYTLDLVNSQTNSLLESVIKTAENIPLKPLIETYHTDGGVNFGKGKERAEAELHLTDDMVQELVNSLKGERRGLTPFTPPRNIISVSSKPIEMIDKIKGQHPDLRKLLEAPQALMWKPLLNNSDGVYQKPKKVPLNKDGGRAVNGVESYSQEVHFNTMRMALLANFNLTNNDWVGVGFDMRDLGPKLFVIDIDRCLDPREPEPLKRGLLDNPAGRMARLLIAAGGLPFYSASGTGLHFWFETPKGMSPPTVYADAYKMGVEVFFPGGYNSKRFVATTLWVYEPDFGPAVPVDMSLDMHEVHPFELIDHWMEQEGLNSEPIGSSNSVSTQSNTKTQVALPTNITSISNASTMLLTKEGLTIRDEHDFFPIAETRGRPHEMILESLNENKKINRLALAYPELWFEDCIYEMGLEMVERGPNRWRASQPAVYKEHVSLFKGYCKEPAGLKDFRIHDEETSKGGSRSPIDLVIDMLYIQKHQDDPDAPSVTTGFPWDELPKVVKHIHQTSGGPLLSEDGELIEDKHSPLDNELKDLFIAAKAWLWDCLANTSMIEPKVELNEAFVALLFSRYVRDELLFDRAKEAWRHFEGVVWSSPSSNVDAGRRKMHALCNVLASIPLSYTQEGKPRSQTKIGSMAFQRGALEAASLRAELSFPDGEEFDGPDTQYLIGVKSLGKIWDAKIGKLIAPNRSSGLTFAIDGEVATISDGSGGLVPDPNSDCSALMKYFNYQFEHADQQGLGAEMFEEFITMIAQQAIGGNPHKVVHVLIGVSNSGKSTLSELIKCVLGRANCATMSNEVLCTNKNGNHPTGMMPMANARSVHVEELSSDRNLKAETLKELTNPEVNMRALYQDAADHRLHGTMIIMTNALPNLRDDAGGAVAKRLRVLKLERSIESMPPEFRESLFAEAPAIRARVLLRMASLAKNGAPKEHPVMIANKGEISGNWDTTQQFIEDPDYVVLEDDNVETAKGVFDLYREWCRDNGITSGNTLGKQQFNRRMAELSETDDYSFYYDKRCSRNRNRSSFIGLRLQFKVSNPRTTEVNAGADSDEDVARILDGESSEE